MLIEALEEKLRVEKINDEMSNKVMNLMKNQTDEMQKELTKEKKRTEQQ